MFRLNAYTDYRNDSDPAYPGGKAIDTPDGDSTEGTQYDRRFFNQIFGFFQSVIFDAYQNMTVSDHPDNINNPEVLDALKVIIHTITDPLLQMIQQNRAGIDTEIRIRQQQYIELLNMINSNSMRITILENAVFNGVIANPFEITFNTLDGIELISGIWNELYGRIECTFPDDYISIDFSIPGNYAILEGVYNTELSRVEC
jgi:hypothetical protein